MNYSTKKSKHLWLIIVIGVLLAFIFVIFSKFQTSSVPNSIKIEPQEKKQKTFTVTIPEAHVENSSNLIPGLLQRQRDIRNLWNSFITPDLLELSYYSQGAGMAVVDLQSLQNIDKPNSRQLYIGLQILSKCEAVSELSESQQTDFDSEGGYINEGFKLSDMYCEGFILDEEEYNSLTKKYLLDLEKEKALELYAGSFAPSPYLENIDRSLYPEKLGELAKLVRDPQDLLLILGHSVAISKNSFSNMAPKQKNFIAASIVAVCSSHIDCDQSNPDDIQLICIMLSSNLCDDHSIDYEQLAQEIAGDTEINQLYQQAENIIIKIKNNDQASIFSAFSTSP